MKKKTKQHKNKSKKKSNHEEASSPSTGSTQAQNKYCRFFPISSVIVVAVAAWMARSSAASTSSMNHGDSTPHFERLFRRYCRQAHGSSSSCSDAIQVRGRELISTSTISPNTQILSVSRSSQIWDIDALRSSLIRDLNLLTARHNISGRPLGNIAYLAAYLALRNRDTAYLQYLPTFTEFRQFHPLAMDKEYLKEKLGGEHSYTYQLILVIQKRIQSEYLAFCTVSSQFQQLVSQETYSESRIHVMSRAFQLANTNVSPPLTEEEKNEFRHLDTMNTYAMIPLLDALDHQHPGNNIAWGRMTLEGDIGIMATQNIKPGEVLYNKYGSTETQEYMFAIYGFLLGNEAISQSLNGYHQTIEPGVELNAGAVAEWQRPQLLQYLTHDDGYPHCIEPSHRTEHAFKLEKFRVLEMIANSPTYWVIKLPARRNQSPEFDSQITDDDFQSILQTCRLLAMTHRDYQGQAHQRLGKIMYHGTLQPMERGSASLEYRSWSWFFRLARTERSKYKFSVTELSKRISNLDSTSSEWSFAQVQLGEIETLDYVIDYADGAMQRLRKDLLGDDSDWLIRDDECPLSFVLSIIA